MFSTYTIEILAFLALCAIYWKRSRVNFFELTQKEHVVLITGAANGLGRCLARILWDQIDGVTLILLDIDAEGLKRVEKSLNTGKNGTIRTYQCDISDENAVGKCMSRIQSDIAPRLISVVVNNAGIATGSKLENLTTTQIRRTFDVNVLGQFWILRHTLPYLKQCNEAMIVTVSSILGLIPAARLSDYCASKAASIGLHESLRLELKHDGLNHIRTLLVCPIAVNTGMFAGAFEGNSLKKKLSRFLIPMLDEEQVARTIFEAMAGGKSLLISCARGWRGMLYPYLFFLIRLLPISWYDAILMAAGADDAMDTLRGRKVQ
uniref:Uncharacterized protein AlNc14C28G2702 n=1 Tax=Albugo laibachii Nc14 TaxID=890382 RepID=F0W774_9STRA|nr:conserved hypothetical protein [Albugo laibachii Nc14]|eukprot:CCA16973.1 conserved hypothetical protein [Albugo laibachii Nc14]